jgi:hypothetical protein
MILHRLTQTALILQNRRVLYLGIWKYRQLTMPQNRVTRPKAAAKPGSTPRKLPICCSKGRSYKEGRYYLSASETCAMVIA